MKKYLICKTCGNLVEVINDTEKDIMCCNCSMEKLISNNKEAAKEKHIPVIELEKNKATINVGSISHPMTTEHYIMWISIKTTKGSYHFDLEPETEPKISIVLDDEEKIINAYAYCNLHGLWSIK